VGAVIHVDADFRFFAPTAPLFDEIGEASIAVSPHDFTPVFADLAVCGRFMNQGYLTRWPDRYSGVHVIRHPGVNLAYWNIATRGLSGVWRVIVDGRPLICYHFSGLFLDEAGVWRNARREFGANLAFAVDRIYAPFLREVEDTDRWLRRLDPQLGPIETGWLKEGEPVGRRQARDDGT
jgi:hypothetical protein